MLSLANHNAVRLAHIEARQANRAGVDCDSCGHPMRVSELTQRVVGIASGVGVECTACPARGVMLL